MTPADLSTGRNGIKRCRNGHAMTKKNTARVVSHGREHNCCLTCRRLAKLRRKPRQGRLSKVEAQRELYRTKVYAMADSEYRRAMLEAFAAFDAWDESDKRPARFGRKYPQQQAKPAKRQKAA